MSLQCLPVARGWFAMIQEKTQIGPHSQTAKRRSPKARTLCVCVCVCLCVCVCVSVCVCVCVCLSHTQSIFPPLSHLSLCLCFGPRIALAALGAGIGEGATCRGGNEPRGHWREHTASGLGRFPLSAPSPQTRALHWAHTPQHVTSSSRLLLQASE